MGQYIIYSRVKDYWAADLPVNRGRWNFDTLRYDYYLDDNVAFEAFKAGAVDRRAETIAKNWATRYVGRNFTHGYIVKDEHPTPRRRIPNGWHSISSARCLTTAGSVKPSPWPSILNG
jgi:ABC-type oligopeptide transport system substrate-binding subunit